MATMVYTLKEGSLLVTDEGKAARLVSVPTWTGDTAEAVANSLRTVADDVCRSKIAYDLTNLSETLAKLCETYGSEGVLKTLQEACDGCADQIEANARSHTKEAFERASTALGFAIDDLKKAEMSQIDLAMGLRVMADVVE